MDDCPADHELSPAQINIMKQTVNKVRETVQRLATDHRDLHSTVSKVGKAIDREPAKTYVRVEKTNNGTRIEGLPADVLCPLLGCSPRDFQYGGALQRGLLEVVNKLSQNGYRMMERSDIVWMLQKP